MLYFSDTVCVFTSSSLPACEGALESSNGDANGPIAELQLDLREESADGARDVPAEGIFWYVRGPLDNDGGKRSESVDSIANPDRVDNGFVAEPPVNVLGGSNCLVTPGVPGVAGDTIEPSDCMFAKMSCPEFTVMCIGCRTGRLSAIMSIIPSAQSTEPVLLLFSSTSRCVRL